jgi:hypothetical protein
MLGSTWESMASDDCDDVVWGDGGGGGATTRASHVNILIDPLFLCLLYAGFTTKSVSHATGIVGTKSVLDGGNYERHEICQNLINLNTCIDVVRLM